MPQSGLGLVDSHAHIQGKEYTGDIAAVIQRAGEAGVEQIIVVGGAGDMSSNTAAVALAESWANLHATVGMHPHDAKDVGEAELQELRKLAAHPKVIAVGETGLDYYYNHSPREVQRRVFAHSSTGGRPPFTFVHERAPSEASELLEGWKNPGDHCFWGYNAACAISIGILSPSRSSHSKMRLET
jgi:TatD DNase family protein